MQWNGEDERAPAAGEMEFKEDVDPGRNRLSLLHTERRGKNEDQ